MNTFYPHNMESIRRKSLLMAVLLILIIGLADTGYAERSRIVLRSGKILYGEIVEQTDEAITLKTGALKMKVLRSDITSIGPEFTPTPDVIWPTSTPTPDQAAILERIGYAWATRLLTTDFSGAYEQCGQEFQQAVSRDLYVAYCRKQLGDSGITAPKNLKVTVDGSSATVLFDRPPNAGELNDPASWPWTSAWSLEEGQWRQAPSVSGEPVKAMIEYGKVIPPTPSPTATLPPRKEPAISQATLVPLAALPTPMPTEKVDEAESPAIAPTAIGGATSNAGLPTNWPSPSEVWEDLSSETQTTIMVLFILHVVFSLWVYVDSRRRVGRGFWMMAGMFLGGILTGCLPLPWLAYLIIRSKT